MSSVGRTEDFGVQEDGVYLHFCSNCWKVFLLLEQQNLSVLPEEPAICAVTLMFKCPEWQQQQSESHFG